MEIVCRGARAAGWDVFFASVRALWSGPTISKPYPSFLHWPDHDPESGLFEHLRRRNLTSALFDVEIMSVYDLDGEAVLPPWVYDDHATRFSVLHTVHGLIHEELFRNQPDEESPVQPGLGHPDRKWTEQTWFRDTVFLIPQAQSPYVLSSAVMLLLPGRTAKYFLGLALQLHTGFFNPSLTVHNAYLVVNMLYQVMTTASWGSLNAEAMMTPAVKSQILMLAGEQCDHALFFRACKAAVVDELITAVVDQMQLPTEPMPWIAAFIGYMDTYISAQKRRLLCETFIQFDHFLTSRHISKYASGCLSEDIATSIIDFLLYLTKVVDYSLYPAWIAGLSRSIKQWDCIHPVFLSFFTNVYTQAARIGRLGEPICADLLKQYYRMVVRPVQARLNCPQDLSRKPSQPVDPRDHLAMEGYRFLVDASQETARFRWTALERDLAQWLWKDTGVSTSLDTSMQPPTLVVKKLSTSIDDWFERRKIAAKSCTELEDVRHIFLRYDPAYSGLLTARDLVDWSFAEGTGPDPAWVSEHDPAKPFIEEPYTPRCPTLARVVSPGSSPTFASPTGSTVSPRYPEPDQDRDDKTDSEPKELDKAEALKSLTLEDYLKRRFRMERKGQWDQLHEEDEEDLQELYLLLGRRKSLPEGAYVTEEVLELIKSPAVGLCVWRSGTNIVETRRRLQTSWIRRLWEHRKGIKLITPADDPTYDHSPHGIKRKRGDDDSESDGLW